MIPAINNTMAKKNNEAIKLKYVPIIIITINNNTTNPAMINMIPNLFIVILSLLRLNP